jgi:hypothetical protein
MNLVTQSPVLVFPEKNVHVDFRETIPLLEYCECGGRVFER